MYIQNMIKKIKANLILKIKFQIQCNISFYINFKFIIYYKIIRNEFKNAGYITAHVVNTCTSQCLFRDKDEKYQKYFNETAADHEFAIWDPLYINPLNYYDLGIGPSAISRRCLYGNDTSGFMYEYGK